MNNYETVVLTGFAGFIGSQILRDLLEKDYIVIGIDNLSEGSDPRNFEDIDHSKFIPIFADISDPNLINYLKVYANLLNNGFYIINCAAQSHVDRSFEQYNKFIKSNISGPVNLAKIALELNAKKFVQVSTDEVFNAEDQPFHENSLINPQNAYSSSKAAAEMFLKNYHRAFGLPLIITNGANTYGERQYKEKIIPLTIDRLLNDKKVPLYKTPAQRMWLHFSDHSSGIIAAMEEGKIGERYCLAPSPENELYTDKLVKLICAILKKDFYECVELVPDRPNYDLRYFMKNEKAKKELNWHPKKDIRKELAKVIEWYVNEKNKKK